VAETAIKREILLEFGARAGIRLFNNPRGVAVYGEAGAKGRVAYGLAPGASDVIGWRSLTITADMVGKQIAQFVAIETKSKGGRMEKGQPEFLAAVEGAGGIAVIAKSNEDVERAFG